MRFGKNEASVFGTIKGAYSEVTDRELLDSQITLVGYEAELVESFFSNDIYRGNVQSNREAAKKRFRLHGTNEIVELNLIYPKENKNELRLYLSKRAGFFPNPGDIVFLYLKKNQIHIGSLGKDMHLPDHHYEEIHA